MAKYIIRKKRDLYLKLPLGLLFLVVLAFSPVIISLIGVWYHEVDTSQPCYDGNCWWSAMGWFLFLSVPFASVLGFIYLLVAYFDMEKLRREMREDESNKVPIEGDLGGE